jgi:ribokinase
MYDVITLGSATIDVFMHSFSELIKIRTSKYEHDFIAYPSGSKQIIQKLIFDSGGGGTNTAVSFSKFGLKTAYIGCIGNDENGKLILNKLKKENVDFLGYKEDKHQTGYSIILDSIEKDRCILTYKGANDYLEFKKLNKDKIKTKWIYSTSMLGESYKSLTKIFKLANQRKIKIAFNPSDYMINKIPELKRILKLVDLLIINEREAFLLTNKKNIKEQFKVIHSMGVKRSIITEGAEGAAYSDIKKMLYIEARKVKVVESTGAGDAFGSAFLAGWIIKKKIRLALHLAVANSTSVIKHRGAKNKLLTFNQALKMKKTKIKEVKNESRRKSN